MIFGGIIILLGIVSACAGVEGGVMLVFVGLCIIGIVAAGAP